MLHALAKSPVGRLARYIRRQMQRPVRPTEGPPPGLSWASLDTLCQEHRGRALQGCSHLHLSSWKPRGTYRLELRIEDGTRWRLVFKDEAYFAEFIPALQELPVLPGPPEATVYRAAKGAFAQFLPRLFWFRELEPGRHFQYLLEDLSEGFSKLRASREHFLVATRGLVALQRAMTEVFGPGSPGILAYDRAYSERMLDYAAGSLAVYCTQTGDESVAALRARWGEVAAVHQRDEFYRPGLYAPIHGDYNPSNIHVHDGDQTQLKAVDWEWAGVGIPHADLAALLKFAPPEDERLALELFAQQNGQLSREEHLRLFRWCQLERGLLDAAFLAKQKLAATRQVPWLQPTISRAAAAALAALEHLHGGTGRAAA